MPKIEQWISKSKKEEQDVDPALYFTICHYGGNSHCAGKHKL